MANNPMGEKMRRVLSIAREGGADGITSNQLVDAMQIKIELASSLLGHAVRYGYMQCIGSRPHRSWAKSCKVYVINQRGLERIADLAPLSAEPPRNVAQGSGKWPDVVPPKVTIRGGVRYTVAPLAPDRRWLADGPGAGFVAEWRERRGQ